MNSVLTFQKLLGFFPKEQRQLKLSARLLIGEVAVVVIAVVFSIYAKAYDSRWLLYMSLGSLALGLLIFVIICVIDVFSGWKMIAKPTEDVVGRLDKKFEEDKKLSGNLLIADRPDLESMKSRLEVEILTIERWVDAMKPLAWLLPAALAISSSDFFHMPKSVASALQLVFAAFIIGGSAAAISLSSALVKLRRISWAISHALELLENKKPSVKKVSRKRLGGYKTSIS